MTRYEFMADVTNTGNLLSDKVEHMPEIKRGTFISYENTPERIEQLIKLDVVRVALDQNEPEEPKPLPDDLKELKKMADSMGIEYASNIGSKTLKERIREHIEG